jgi:hypothetical protein
MSALPQIRYFRHAGIQQELSPPALPGIASPFHMFDCRGSAAGLNQICAPTKGWQ